MPDGQSSLDSKRTELLFRIAESVSGEVGADFLKALASSLQEAMDVTLALITVGEGEPITRARAVYAIENGEIAGDILYDLENTPCAMVYTGQRVVIPCDLAQHFPTEAGLASYVGVPLFSENGDVSGHVAVLSEKPIEDADFAESLVRIFAQRVEAERRRSAAAAQREELIQDLRVSSLKLRRRYETLRVANAFKTRLLGMIAHDLRNPLAAIVAQAELAMTQLAGAEPKVERARKSCERIIDNAERMSVRIRSTLEDVRMDTVSLRFKPAPVDMSGVISTAVEVNRPAALSKDIVIVMPDDVGYRCFGNEDLLLDAVDNLISNAVKYSNRGSRVEIRCEGNDGMVRVIVRDEGQGLTEADLKRAFQPFQLLSAQPTGGENSVGLGLSNVREIAEAHGGRVWAESLGRGQGATFHLEIPIEGPCNRSELN
ncbi:HAMP domain-containing histidine kinase [Stappia sp. F7233]|uniref:histidine kinase n=1 Tax=Stappia albiluteola TaxID=2758565 RepID=A0A839AI63_9HYPH|nr:HAMP domain-containing sensor histidine kinase [Stappia albiluteola]MBA5778199.1 HAMP domain-containing histidine kinase [Stappia albiluteola]